MPEPILLETHATCFEIVLNRAEKRNAITWPMLKAIGEAIDQAEKTPGMRAILLRGEGRGFSAGIDLIAFGELAEHFGENWASHMLAVTAAFQAVMNKMEHCALPVIALLHGYTLGLGLELALACDFRLAAEDTRLSLPETRLGLVPDVGGTTRLARLVGPARAKELILTGRSIDASCAERWGLINTVVSAGELYSHGQALVAEISQCAPRAVSFAKRVIDGASDMERGLQLEAWAQSQLIQMEDFQVGVQAMLAKTPPEWRNR